MFDVDPWPERMLRQAREAAKLEWGPGWALLSDAHRQAVVAQHAMVLIAGLDADGDCAARAARIRKLAELTTSTTAVE